MDAQANSVLVLETARMVKLATSEYKKRGDQIPVAGLGHKTSLSQCYNWKVISAVMVGGQCYFCESSLECTLMH